jgi:hypothetical protein
MLFPQSVPAGLHISPRSIDFGEDAVNSDSGPRSITLTNPTHSAISFTQILTSGIDFAQKNDCAQTLVPGAQCTIQVVFTPAISGPRIGSLSIMGSDSASPHFVALTGTGK